MNICEKEVSFFTIILFNNENLIYSGHFEMSWLYYNTLQSVASWFLGFRKMDFSDQHNYRIIQKMLQVFFQDQECLSGLAKKPMLGCSSAEPPFQRVRELTNNKKMWLVLGLRTRWEQWTNHRDNSDGFTTDRKPWCLF